MTHELRVWPEWGLESCAACPVCEGTARTTWATGLEDRVFGCAPGTWTVCLCGDCGSAYLDPRPTRDTVGEAYRDYYTHVSQVSGNTPKRSLAASRVPVRHGCLHRRLGLGLDAPSRLAPLALP